MTRFCSNACVSSKDAVILGGSGPLLHLPTPPGPRVLWKAPSLRILFSLSGAPSPGLTCARALPPHRLALLFLCTFEQFHAYTSPAWTQRKLGPDLMRLSWFSVGCPVDPENEQLFNIPLEDMSVEPSLTDTDAGAGPGQGIKALIRYQLWNRVSPSPWFFLLCNEFFSWAA